MLVEAAVGAFEHLVIQLKGLVISVIGISCTLLSPFLDFGLIDSRYVLVFEEYLSSFGWGEFLLRFSGHFYFFLVNAVNPVFFCPPSDVLISH